MLNNLGPLLACAFAGGLFTSLLCFALCTIVRPFVLWLLLFRPDQDVRDSLGRVADQIILIATGVSTMVACPMLFLGSSAKFEWGWEPYPEWLVAMLWTISGLICTVFGAYLFGLIPSSDELCSHELYDDEPSDDGQKGESGCTGTTEKVRPRRLPRTVTYTSGLYRRRRRQDLTGNTD